MEITPADPVYNEVKSNHIFYINPLHYVPGIESILEVKFKTVVKLNVGEEVWLEFETFNKIEKVFDSDLGSKAILNDLVSDFRELDCIE